MREREVCVSEKFQDMKGCRCLEVQESGLLLEDLPQQS